MKRFWSKVEKTEGCWNWTACLTHDGYGRFSLKRKARLAHVISYLLSGNEIPDGMTLDHKCRNRKCVNPDHLEPKTGKENVLCGESFSAKNARKTECVNGHELTQENTYIRPNGNRDCRACIRTRGNKYSKRQRSTSLGATT